MNLRVNPAPSTYLGSIVDEEEEGLGSVKLPKAQIQILPNRINQFESEDFKPFTSRYKVVSDPGMKFMDVENQVMT